MSLSACLIVRDEEMFLERCLSSLRGHVDEICVLDTGSRDRTVEIARAHGARVGFRAWDDDFSAARNACLDLASGDWILQIDADEELVVPDGGALSRLQREAAVCHLVELDLRGSNGRSERAWQPRLFRRDPRLRYARALHETILDHLADAGLPPPEPCRLLLVHHGYLDEIVAARGKIERNLRILRTCRDRGRADAYDLFKLAAALEASPATDLERELRETWAACLAAGRAVPASRRAEWPWWPRACTGAAIDLWLGGDLSGADRVFAEIAATDAGDPDLRRARGEFELARGDAAAALAEGRGLPDAARLRALALLALAAPGEADAECAKHATTGAALQARIAACGGRGMASVGLLEASFPSLGDDAEALVDAAETLLALGERETARSLLRRPARGTRIARAAFDSLRARTEGGAGREPPRDTHEAAGMVFRAILQGRNPSLDPAFRPGALRRRIADLLEERLAAGDEASVRAFAAKASAWESRLPGVSNLVEGS